MKTRLPIVAAVLLAAPYAHADPTTPPSGPVAPVKTPTDSTRQLRFTGGIALTGIGGITLVLGAVLGVRALVSRNEVGSHCGPSGACDLTGYTLYAQARDFGLISTAVFIGGGVLAAGGIGLIVSARPLPSSTSAWIRPTPGGVAIGARF